MNGKARSESMKSGLALVYFLACAVWFSSVLARTSGIRFGATLSLVVGLYAAAGLLSRCALWLRGRWREVAARRRGALPVHEF